MQVILLESVQNLGALGDTVKVKPGYARNYLIPQGIAAPATPGNVAMFEARRAELERQQREAEDQARARAARLEGLEVTVARKAGEEGKLFGSVGTQDIADAVTAQGAEVERNEIRLPEGPLREVGDYDIELHLYAEVDATITVHVVPEE